MSTPSDRKQLTAKSAYTSAANFPSLPRSLAQFAPEFVVSQLDIVYADITSTAAKTGALGNAAVFEVIAERAERFLYPLVRFSISSRCCFGLASCLSDDMLTVFLLRLALPVAVQGGGHSQWFAFAFPLD